MDHYVRLNKCLKCGGRLDGATNVGDSDQSPEVGDLSVCLQCGHVMEFGLGLVLQELSDQAVLDHAGDKNLLTAVRMSEIFRQWFVTRPGKNKR